LLLQARLRLEADEAAEWAESAKMRSTLQADLQEVHEKASSDVLFSFAGIFVQCSSFKEVISSPFAYF